MNATITTAAAQIGEGRTPHYVRTDSFHTHTMCGRLASRLFTDRQLAKLGASCKRCDRALAAAVELAASTVKTPAVETPAVDPAPAAEETPAPAATPQPPADRYTVEVRTVMAHPGYRETRFTIHPAGKSAADPFLLVALPADSNPNTRTVLSALGWHLTGRLEYFAGINAERGRVEPMEPTHVDDARELRAAVAREVTARLTAHAGSSRAAHFRPVLPVEGGPYPIGWTYRNGFGEDNEHAPRYGWVTAAGLTATALGVFTREEAERAVRSHHAAGTDAPVDDTLSVNMHALPAADLGQVFTGLRTVDPSSAFPLGEREAQQLVTETWPRADRFESYHGRGGELFGYTFQVGSLHSARYGWIAATGTCSRRLESYRSGATDLLVAAVRDEQAPLPLPAAVPFKEGDRVVCGDGVSRTVVSLRPALGEEPASLVTDTGGEWIAANCLRANPSDLVSARKASTDAMARLRRSPGPTDPNFGAALIDLSAALDFLMAASPICLTAAVEDRARAAAAAVHPNAHGFQPVSDGEQPAGWSFRCGYGSAARYGVVTAAGEVSPVGLYEYRVTVERVFLRGATGSPADVAG